MAFEVTDGAANIKALLTDSWTASNVDDTTPTIGVFDDYKGGDLRVTDFILLRTTSQNYERNAIGSTSKRKRHVVMIDIRSGTSRSRMQKLKGEVVRILDTGLINPHSANLTSGTWDWIDRCDVSWTDLSDRTKKMWRMVASIELVLATMAR